MKKYKKKIWCYITFSVLILDLSTKYWIQAQVYEHLKIDDLSQIHGTFLYHICPFFDLVFVKNFGISFGLFNHQHMAQQWILGVFALLIVGYIVKYINTATTWLLLGLSLISGGALGNSFSRFIDGYITDFIDFYFKSYHWPAFNVADAAITIGAFIFFADSCIAKQRRVQMDWKELK